MNMTSHKFKLISMLIIGTLVIVTSVFVSTVYAKGANKDHANPVAPGANTNGPYMKLCKQFDNAKDCATGPGNNGEFTSGLAHGFNKP
jgi:hypothetical protein